MDNNTNQAIASANSNTAYKKELDKVKERKDLASKAPDKTPKPHLQDIDSNGHLNAKQLEELNQELLRKDDSGDVFNTNLTESLHLLNISDPEIAESAQNLVAYVDEFIESVFSPPQDPEAHKILQKQSELSKQLIMQELDHYIESQSKSSLSMLDDYYSNVALRLNSQSDPSNVLAQLMNSKNPNILFLALLAFLAAADVDATLILSNNAQMMANNDKRKYLNKVLNAFQSMSTIVPYTGSDSNTTIDDLFTLFAKAFGREENRELKSALTPFQSILENITNADGISYWALLNEYQWSEIESTSVRSYFNSMFDGLFKELNQTLIQVGGSETAGFSKDSNDNYILGSTQLNNIISNVQQGSTSAGSISQDQNLIMQATQQVYQLHFQAATTCLQLSGKINDFIYSRV